MGPAKPNPYRAGAYVLVAASGAIFATRLPLDMAGFRWEHLLLSALACGVGIGAGLVLRSLPVPRALSEDVPWLEHKLDLTQPHSVCECLGWAAVWSGVGQLATAAVMARLPNAMGLSIAISGVGLVIGGRIARQAPIEEDADEGGTLTLDDVQSACIATVEPGDVRGVMGHPEAALTARNPYRVALYAYSAIAGLLMPTVFPHWPVSGVVEALGALLFFGFAWFSAIALGVMHRACPIPSDIQVHVPRFMQRLVVDVALPRGALTFLGWCCVSLGIGQLIGHLLLDCSLDVCVLFAIPVGLGWVTGARMIRPRSGEESTT